MAGKKVKLKDVAQRAGVSIMSVSKAINQKPGLSDETRARILKVVEEMGYTQNPIARSLRTSRTKTIGAVVNDTSNMVMFEVLCGIQNVARERGYSVIIADAERDFDKERQVAALLLQSCVDGLAVIAPRRIQAEEIAYLRNTGVPVSYFLRNLPAEDIDAFVSCNYDASYQLTTYLIEKGCRNFAFVTMSKERQTTYDRLSGGVQALKDNGIKYDFTKTSYAPPTVSGGYIAVANLLERDVSFDACVCFCDLQAVGAIEALKKYGKRIPEDVQVTGFDDIEMVKYLSVPLTTMRQSFYEIGVAGGRQLIDRIENPKIPAKKQLFPCNLIIRNSTLK